MIDWGGALSGALARITPELRSWFIEHNERVTSDALKLLEAQGWDLDAEETARLAREHEANYRIGVRADLAASAEPREKWAKFWRERPRPKEWTEDELARDMGEPSRATREWIAEGVPTPEPDPQEVLDLGEVPARAEYSE